MITAIHGDGGGTEGDGKIQKPEEVLKAVRRGESLLVLGSKGSRRACGELLLACGVKEIWRCPIGEDELSVLERDPSIEAVAHEVLELVVLGTFSEAPGPGDRLLLDAPPRQVRLLRLTAERLREIARDRRTRVESVAADPLPQVRLLALEESRPQGQGR